MINWLRVWPFVKIVQCAAKPKQNKASSHRKFWEILNKIGHTNCVLVQKLQQFCWKCGFCLWWVELHWEGSAPAAWRAGLSKQKLKYYLYDLEAAGISEAVGAVELYSSGQVTAQEVPAV